MDVSVQDKCLVLSEYHCCSREGRSWDKCFSPLTSQWLYSAGSQLWEWALGSELNGADCPQLQGGIPLSCVMGKVMLSNQHCLQKYQKKKKLVSQLDAGSAGTEVPVQQLPAAHPWCQVQQVLFLPGDTEQTCSCLHFCKWGDKRRVL